MNLFTKHKQTHRLREQTYRYQEGQIGSLDLTCTQCVLVTQSWPTLLPHGLQPARLLCLWNSPGKNTEVGCHFLLQGIFLAQGLNPGLLHCRQFPYDLSYREIPCTQCIFKIDNQQGPIVQHMKLCSILCHSLKEFVITYSYICINESLCYIPKPNILFIN